MEDARASVVASAGDGSDISEKVWAAFPCPFFEKKAPPPLAYYHFTGNKKPWSKYDPSNSKFAEWYAALGAAASLGVLRSSAGASRPGGSEMSIRPRAAPDLPGFDYVPEPPSHWSPHGHPLEPSWSPRLLARCRTRSLGLTFGILVPCQEGMSEKLALHPEGKPFLMCLHVF